MTMHTTPSPQEIKQHRSTRWHCTGPFFLALAAVVWTSATTAQEIERPRWVLKAEATTCDLTRTPGSSGSTVFEISGSADGTFASLLFADTTWKRHLVRFQRPAELVLLPGGERIRGKAHPLSVAARQGHGLALYGLDQSFFNIFSGATGLAVEVDGKRVVEFAFSEAARAIAVLGECNNSLLRSWGIDPQVNASLLRRPMPAGDGSVAQWFRVADYPSEAISRGASGTVVVRITVDTEGRVSDCAIAVSSGDQALDQRSCAVITRRGRYEPATRFGGVPTVAKTTTKVSWMLPTG